MSRLEDRNYWGDSRVRFRDPNHAAWRINEQRRIAIVGEALRPDCDDCEGCGEPCDAHAPRTLTDEEQEAHQEDERKAGGALPRPGELAVPFRWAVCPQCDGRGTHVNPSIDCGGLTREDFDEDPDFEEAYFAGRYDVTCGECQGRRVVPELAPVTDEERAAVLAIEERERDDARYERDCRMERMMGA